MTFDAIADWSAARQRCEACYIRGGDEHDEALGPPWRLIEIDGLAAGPAPSQDVAFDATHIERDMVVLMEAQRREFRWWAVSVSSRR